MDYQRYISYIMKCLGISFLVVVTLNLLHLKAEPVPEVEVEVVYYGAVLEYEPFNDWDNGEGGQGIIWYNAERLTEIAYQAEGADILVAPEYGLQSLDMRKDNRSEFMSLTQYVPDPSENVIPCNEDLKDVPNVLGIHRLSCTAQELKMYLVIDLPERFPCNPETVKESPWVITSSADHECTEEGFIYHNTQVVFDRDGQVVARYRKQNLYLEPAFTPGGEEDSTAIFTTDFGVTFTLQICFDISFEHPGYSNVIQHGIRNVIMSTAWVDELPFLIAPSVQNGWSRSLEANLLVSGYHRPEAGKLGSGIWRYEYPTPPLYTFDKESGNVLLVAPVKTLASNVTAAKIYNAKKSSKTTQDEIIYADNNSKDNAAKRFHLILHEDLSIYTMKDLVNTNNEPVSETLCHPDDDFCCELTYQSNSSYHYKFLVYSGIVQKGNYTYQIYAQSCGLVWCGTENLNSCGVIELGIPEDDSFGPATFTATFEAPEIAPVGVRRDLTVYTLDSDFSIEGNVATHSLPEAKGNVLSFGLFGRWYSRDPQ